MVPVGNEAKRPLSVTHTTKVIHHHHYHHHYHHHNHQNQYKKLEITSRASHETDTWNICFTDLERKLSETAFFEIHSMFYIFSCVCVDYKP